MRQQTLADEGFERYRKPTQIGKVRLKSAIDPENQD